MITLNKRDPKGIARLSELIVGVDEERKVVAYSAIAIVLVDKYLETEMEDGLLRALNGINREVILDFPMAKKVLYDFIKFAQHPVGIESVSRSGMNDPFGIRNHIGQYEDPVIKYPFIFKEIVGLMNSLLVSDK